MDIEKKMNLLGGKKSKKNNLKIVFKFNFAF